MGQKTLEAANTALSFPPGKAGRVMKAAGIGVPVSGVLGYVLYYVLTCTSVNAAQIHENTAGLKAIQPVLARIEAKQDRSMEREAATAASVAKIEGYLAGKER